MWFPQARSIIHGVHQRRENLRFYEIEGDPEDAEDTQPVLVAFLQSQLRNRIRL